MTDPDRHGNSGSSSSLTTGPWKVVKHGRRFTVEDVLDPFRNQPIFDTEDAATIDVARRNASYQRRRAPRPAQPSLFPDPT